MSATVAGLRRKIDSANDLQSVVRAMKAQAAASIEQYERSVAALGDYHRTVSLGLGVCIRHGGIVARPQERRRRAVSVIVFGSDQGLVGRFNDVVGDLAKTLIAAHTGAVVVWAVGQRVRERLVDAQFSIEGQFDVPASVDAIAPLVGEILVAYEKLQVRGNPTELHLVYNQSAPAVAYQPVTLQLLPLDDAWRASQAAIFWPTPGLPELLVADATTLAAFIREYLFVSLFRACAESLASENASRLAAMQRADKNINGLLEELNGGFHRLRQDEIDEELFDVVAGYEALRTDEGRPG
jgi:F-type H+-transporting ATPase subunit gamma